MGKRNHRRQEGRAFGSTKAERQRRRQQLEATLEWVLDNYMKPVEDGITTVISASIGEETGLVHVMINQDDPQFVERLMVRSPGRVQVVSDPNTLDPLASPSPLPPLGD